MGVNGDALTHERPEETTAKPFDALTPSGR
jgi:hypothetical protein